MVKKSLLLLFFLKNKEPIKKAIQGNTAMRYDCEISWQVLYNFFLHLVELIVTLVNSSKYYTSLGQLVQSECMHYCVEEKPC